MAWLPRGRVCQGDDESSGLFFFGPGARGFESRRSPSRSPANANVPWGAIEIQGTRATNELPICWRLRAGSARELTEGGRKDPFCVRAGGQKVAGSNPVAPTSRNRRTEAVS